MEQITLDVYSQTSRRNQQMRLKPQVSGDDYRNIKIEATCCRCQLHDHHLGADNRHL